ncbi:MAG TPA: ABC transporter substrate-binding protein [Patescibacteria group bacterium]|nr:ABC transporter substrate-binding protein [Patescibacteria group bacterium]
MSIVRRRYYFWLAKAYVKKWKKTILSSIVGGVLVFFIIFALLDFYLLPLIQKKVQKIGYSGSYTVTNLPNNILQNVSYGLTKVEKDGSITPAAAYKWDIKNSGKTYIFYIRKGQYFNGHNELTAQNINVSFKDVTKKVIDDYTVEYDLKDPYAPFLATMSKPILYKNFSGLGQYKVTKVELNGGFVKTINMQDKNHPEYKKIIIFYPTNEALKIAFVLGDLDVIESVPNVDVDNQNLANWNNTKVEKTTDYSELVTLFYNNADSILSDKRIRQALSYALPSTFKEGERAYSPIPPTSVYFSKGPNYGISDLSIAKSLLDGQNDLKKQTLIISTTPEYQELAQEVINSWSKLGVKAKIKVEDKLPDKFQILLYPIKLPEDPDQYTIWHSTGINNIMNYKNNKRIDKLLEDGRSTTDKEKRLSIYADFQKYLIDDAPASFLYFPYSYNISRL